MDETCDISIVIIHYKMVPDLMACLESIFRNECTCSFEVLVVHKDAGENLKAALDRKFPEVRLILHDRFGIARSRNLGIHAATGRHTLILDADACLTEGALDGMVKFMDDRPECGAAGGKLLGADGSLQLSCRRFYTLRAVLLRRTPLGRVFPGARTLREHLMLDWDHDDDRKIDWMQGACFLMRGKAIEQVGAFDDRYVFGFEDVDWCFRARKAGWEVRYMPDVKVIHRYQRSSAKFLSKNQFKHLKSGLYFYFKHHTFLGRMLKP